MRNPPKPLLSVVIPCFNEQDVIRETHRRLSSVLNSLPIKHEILYVDDGSRDSTPRILEDLQRRDAAVRVIQFSRNFGHQVAVSAGMDHASGDAVVLIDADLQDPPEVIRDFLARWNEGFDVAFGQRTERQGETFFKRFTASLFYRVLSKLTPIDIPRDTGDFRLMDRRVVDAIRQMPERDRFIRGMVSWVGFRQIAVPYRREARFSGDSKYPFKKMLDLGCQAIIAFSPVPLRAISFAGVAVTALSFITAAVFLIAAVSGLSSQILEPLILISLLFLSGVQLISVGVLGEYLNRTHQQVQGRPLYVVRKTSGFEAQRETILRVA